MKTSLPFKYIVSVKRDKYYVVFDFKDDNGKRQRRWVGTGLPSKSTKKVLNEKVDELVAQFYEDYCSGNATKPREKIKKNTKNAEFLNRTLSAKSSAFAFTQFLSYWLDAIKPTVSDTTYESYTHVIRKTTEYFDEKYPNLMLDEITALQIQQFYNDKYNSGLTANTIKHYHANIHKALKYAIKMDWLPNNPSEKTELPKLKKFQANFYNAEELAELFKAFKGDRLELVVHIAAYYGMRRSEVLGLKWDCIDFDRKKITIRRKLIYRMGETGDELFLDEELKTKASVRTLPLIPHIEAMLKERFFLEQYYSNLLKDDFDHTFDGFVCRDSFGKIITPNYTSQHFQIVIANNNLRYIRFHDLRHSCASLLLANGVPMKAIQEWLGHSTFNITADFYSHLEYSSKIASAETIAKVFSNDDESNLKK
ncbi:MAG: site-specific integrase [Ruminococcus sp.]|nr:site-specific integrase [Ruminococcus sp.]